MYKICPRTSTFLYDIYYPGHPFKCSYNGHTEYGPVYQCLAPGGKKVCGNHSY